VSPVPAPYRKTGAELTIGGGGRSARRGALLDHGREVRYSVVSLTNSSAPSVEASDEGNWLLYTPAAPATLQIGVKSVLVERGSAR
jgi:hypothetical protein